MLADPLFNMKVQLKVQQKCHTGWKANMYQYIFDCCNVLSTYTPQTILHTPSPSFKCLSCPNLPLFHHHPPHSKRTAGSWLMSSLLVVVWVVSWWQKSSSRCKWADELWADEHFYGVLVSLCRALHEAWGVSIILAGAKVEWWVWNVCGVERMSPWPSLGRRAVAWQVGKEEVDCFAVPSVNQCVVFSNTVWSPWTSRDQTALMKIQVDDKRVV